MKSDALNRLFSNTLRRLPRALRRYRYHFIHIPKNGGNSVRRALSLRWDVSLSNPYHYRYVDVVDDVGRDLKYFCIIRNPWSRTVSRYLFAKQQWKKWAEDDPRRDYFMSATFEKFVQDQKIFDTSFHPGQPWMGPVNSWFDQLEWVRDATGNVVCDCLRLEEIDHDLSQYFGTKIRLPHRNVTRDRRDYRTLYTDELAETVARTFYDDIAYFGFTFDGSATKNIAVEV